MSKLLMYDFECPCGFCFEELVHSDTQDVQCPVCLKQAKRVIPAPRINMTAMALSESASPESIRHFDRIHRQRKAIEEKKYAEHRDHGKAPGSD